MSSAADPPDKDEIELSLFGPGTGYGEAIAVHVGDGKWLLIDSCLDPVSHEPASLAYLKSLGVDVARDVKWVIASHWHDDHIKGLTQLLVECTAAKFVCPVAMNGDEFRTLAEAYAVSPLKDDSGITEFAGVFRLLAERKQPPALASISRRLDSISSGPAGLPFDMEIWALSPSDPAMISYVRRLAKLIDKDMPRVRIPSTGPNDAAVVIQIIVGNESMLLGSDLENSGAHGWSIILNDAGRPPQISHSYKVAHHGSETGHDDTTWTGLLEPKPFAFLTPFRKGGVRLPKGTDVDRIRKWSGDKKAFITVPLSYMPGKRAYSKEIDKGLKAAGANPRIAFNACGQIQFRFIPGNIDSRRVTPLGGAVPL